MQEQIIKACLAAGKHKEDTSLFPFYSRLINKSRSTSTNICLNVNIAVLLLTLNTINSLLQSRKCRQMETNLLKLYSKSKAELVWKVKKKKTLLFIIQTNKRQFFSDGIYLWLSHAGIQKIQLFKRSCSFFFNLSRIELLPVK